MAAHPRLKIWLAVGFLVAGACAARSAAAEEVTIASGTLRGAAADGVVSFKGIPFAEPPIGTLRWRAPRPAQRWDGVRDATAFGPSCMQTDDLIKSEDCLTLNVWRPAKADAPLPVMVWIYGGALAHGNTPQYPMEALAAQGVVAVSMNYRMGRLGFFAHPALAAEAPEEPRGNYGFLDQLAALRWVQQNIVAFGGDPAKVTIFGESAGGGSVMAHMISPLPRGPFRAAILQSPGVPTAREKVLPLTALADAEGRAIAYARSVGIDDDGLQGLAALRALPADKLVEGASAPLVLAGMSSGLPVVGVSGSILDGRFLTETPEAAFAAGRQAKVPVIVGANNRDLGIGSVRSKEDLFALFGDLAAEARRRYDPQGSESFDELKQQILADKTLVEPSRHLADEMVRAGQPTWWYRFSYVAEALRGDPKWKGTLHGFEIPYVFDIPAAVVRDKVTDADKAMGSVASAYWVAFAKSSDPNGGGRPTWPQHDPAKDEVIDFTNAGVVVGPDPLRPRLDLWKAVQERRPAFAMAGAPSDLEEYDGTVVAAEQADIAPRLDALLSKISFRAGQVVRQGDLLFEFEAREKELTLALAEARRDQAEADLRLAEVALKNAQTLKKKNVASAMTLLEAEAKRDIAAARAKEAKTNVSLAELALKQMKLYASITGVISQPFVSQGTYITKEAREQSRLATIVQLDPIRVVGRVPFSVYFARRDVLGTPDKAARRLTFTLLLPGGEAYPQPGKLVAGSYAFDAATQTIAIAVEFPNPDYLLRPGLEVRLRSAFTAE